MAGSRRRDCDLLVGFRGRITGFERLSRLGPQSWSGRPVRATCDSFAVQCRSENEGTTDIRRHPTAVAGFAQRIRTAGERYPAANRSAPATGADSGAVATISADA